MTFPEDSAPRPAASAGRARRRQARRLIVPRDAEGQAALLATLARRAFPSYELFVFALLCGIFISLGYLFDSQAILLLGLLLAPLLTPWVGLLLALITASPRFFFETFMALLISLGMVFLSALLTGLASRLFQPLTFTNAFLHSRLWIPDLFLLTLGAILLPISFVRSENKPLLPGILLGYAIFLPLGAAGFGLGSGVSGIWPQGMLVFAAHLALATFFGLLALLTLRFRLSFGGVLLSGLTLLVSLGIFLWLAIPGPWMADLATNVPTPQAAPPSPTSGLILQPTATATPPASSTPRIATATFGPTASLTPTPPSQPSQTPTATLTLEPTPIIARIRVDEGGGVRLRKTPNGEFVTLLENGTYVQVLPDVVVINDIVWAHVVATRNGVRLEGWVIQSALVMPTPVPNWQPSATPTTTITSTP
jgi:hypothetical protein